jgi:UDP-N-acetylmuramate: L-alanyl-gamma-D-glutamyl-meso-diaminopimelate ligase
MASLAGMLKERGYEVFGSDQNVYPPMSTQLAQLGIEVFNGYDESNLNSHPDLVVVGNALSRGNPEVERVLDERIPYCSMPEAVKNLFVRGHLAIVVAGTHGKTTTTSLLAWIFERAGLKPSFLVGGIAQNFGKSYQLGGGPHFIIEGDEYDTAFFDKGPKFLHYLPHSVIVNNVEFDHADIYADFDAIKLAFRRLINIIPQKGNLFVNVNDPLVVELAQKAFCQVVPFGIVDPMGKENSRSSELDGAFVATDIRVKSEGTAFTVMHGGRVFGQFTFPLFGNFNVSNAVAAIATAARYGIAPEVMGNSLLTFQSVRRRMEVRGQVNGITVIDDFGHHPTAIRETLRAVRSRYPNGRLWVAVEPRSATMRRSVSEQGLAQALAEADEIVLAAPFAPEKIAPQERLDPARVASSLANAGKSARFIPTANEIVATCGPLLRSGDVFIIFSNGSFDGIHEKVLQALKDGAKRC